MKSYRTKGQRHLNNAESGFTLVELIVVVAIIVSLAGFIMPQVAQFHSRGDDGAKEAERDNLQTAFDTYRANNGGTTVTANILFIDTSSNDFSAATGIVNLSPYMRRDATEYFYCWDSSGLITNQDPVATPDCTRTN